MTDESNDLWQKLAAPFPPEVVSWRVGPTNGDKTKGMALAYIDARDVMNRLDMFVGPDGWQCRYPHTNGKTVCEIDIWIEGRGWVTKADGAGDTDMEAEKGALSDAFKRAAVRWGIGRYLYDIDSAWVAIEPAGKSFKIKQEEYTKLRGLLNPQRPTKAGTMSPWGDREPVAGTGKKGKGDMTVTALGESIAAALLEIEGATGDAAAVFAAVQKHDDVIEQCIRRKPAWWNFHSDPERAMSSRIEAVIASSESSDPAKMQTLRGWLANLETRARAAAVAANAA